MRPCTLIRIALALAFASTALGFGTQSRADRLITQGIGISNCAKLAADLKPSAGLDHQANYLLFYWVQGYLSAANIYLLNEYTDFVDLAGVDEKTILQVVADFCKANPDKKPIAAIDKFIRDAKKVEAKEADAFDPWEH